MNVYSGFCRLVGSTSNHSPTYRVLYAVHLSASVDPGDFRRLVGSSGLEPPTSRLSGARSNHLSYEPIQFFDVSLVYSRFSVFLPMVEMMGIEPMTPCLQGRCSPS